MRMQQGHAPGSPTTSPTAADDGAPQPLMLLEGQCAALQLRLKNVGAFAIDHVAVEVQCENNLLAKYGKDCHPLVHFTGVALHAGVVHVCVMNPERLLSC